MKKNLQILGVEDFKDGRPRVTKNGKKFARINTNEGWYGCFDEETFEALKKFIDQWVSVELKSNNSGETISKCYGAFQGEEPKPATSQPEEINAPVIRPGENKKPPYKSQNAMYVSYAKDLLVAIMTKELIAEASLEELMDIAIKAIKQAQKAFE